MKVIGVLGGPHRNGNTAKLIEAVLEGATEVGHDVVFVRLADIHVRHIEERDEKLYYPEDDLSKLYPEFESMGALVLATPIYYDQVDSRMKQFIDRLHYWSKTHGEVYRARFPDGVKLVNCITFANPSDNYYDNVLTWMKVRMEHYWNMEHVCDLKASETRKNPVTENNTLLEKAKILGKCL